MKGNERTNLKRKLGKKMYSNVKFEVDRSIEIPKKRLEGLEGLSERQRQRQREKKLHRNTRFIINR